MPLKMLAEHERKSLHRLAVGFAVIGLLLAALTIPAQTGLFAPRSSGWWACVACAVIAGILWVVALCLVSRARGYHPLWGLTLLIPPFIILYPFVFRDRYHRGRRAKNDAQPITRANAG